MGLILQIRELDECSTPKTLEIRLLDSGAYPLYPGSANLVCKGPKSNYFCLCGLHSFSCNHSTPPVAGGQP